MSDVLKFAFRKTENDKWDIVFENAPENLSSLPSSPEKMEDKLKVGQWLVMLCAIYSPIDVKAIVLTARGIKGYEKNIRVGIRPFYDYDENKKWFPEYEEPFSPVWVFFKDGKVTSQKQFNEFLDEDDKWSEKKFRNWLEKQID